MSTRSNAVLRDGAIFDGRARRPASDWDAGVQPGMNDGFDIKDVLKVMRRRWPVIAGVVIVATSLTAVVATRLAPRFQATAAVLIEPRPHEVLDFRSAIGESPNDDGAISTEMALLASIPYAERAIRELDVLEHAEFNIVEDGSDGWLDLAWLPESWLPFRSGHAEQETGGAGSQTGPSGPGEGLLERLRTFVTGLIGGGEGVDVAAMPLPAAPTQEQILNAAAVRLIENLSVSQYGETYVLLIGYWSSDPSLAAQVANKIAEIYVKDRLQTKKEATTSASEWLHARIQEMRDQLLESEGAIEQYKAEHGLLASEGVRLDDQQLSSLNRDLIVAQAERAEREARLKLVQDLRARGQSLASVPEVMNSPVVSALRQQQALVTREMAQLSQEYGPRHPTIVRLAAEEEELRQKVWAEISNIVRGMENEVEAARARERSLRGNLEGAIAASAATNQEDVKLRMLEREADANRSFYSAFLTRFKELSEQKDLLQADARVVSAASVPEVAAFPRPKLMVAAGFTGSLMLGVVLAFLSDRLDSGIRSGRQVQDILGIGNLGFVPAAQGINRRGGLVTHLIKRSNSAYAEAVRSVHTTIRLSSIDDPPQVLMVTSSLPGEGKTTLAASIAISIARSGPKTVLVDLDLRRARLGATLGFGGRQPGLVEHLADQVELDAIVRADPAVYPNLDVIPVTGAAPNPTDLLSSRRMEAFFDQLRREYSMVVVDSAPVLGISDTRVAVRLADAVVFAVRWGKTNEDIARNGLEALFESHARVAGAVLTRVHLRRHARYGFGDVAQYYGKYKAYYTT